MTLAEKYPNNAMAFRITADSGRVYQYNAPRYSAYKINFADFRKKIEDLTGKTFSESTTFIIYYNYKDDVCSDWYSNNINSELIKRKKEYHDPFKVYIEKTYPNTVFLVLYEKGITLSDSLQYENEYFFSDKNNNIRENIFRNPTVCGSFSITKYDGTTLIYNGETTADSIAGHLKPEIWNSIFKTQ
ncbi:hypothetical protein FSS13T_19770 [Flavobacterium saliperosum S13]|nr:hypothetical protein FSS13T_19770 [Flavobacterium saliperosum S13]